MPARLATLLAALVLLGSLAVPALARSGSSAVPLDPATRRVLAYWTPARMRAAIPRTIVRDERGFRYLSRTEARRAVRATKPSASASSSPSSAPSATTCGLSSGLDWTCGGPAQVATGKVYFTIGASQYTCSGSVIDDAVSGRSIVLTAGHCVYDQRSGAFVTNWLFVPEYDATPGISSCSAAKWGCWVASALVAHSGWTSQSGLTVAAVQHDWGFAVVGSGGTDGTRQLDATVGSFPIAFPGLSLGATAYAFGYPAEKGFDGQRLIYCAGPVDYDPSTLVTWRLAGCKLNGGSSGGPWLAGFSSATGTGTAASVNSYILRGTTAIFGPVFNAKTQATYTAALGAVANTTVN